MEVNMKIMDTENIEVSNKICTGACGVKLNIRKNECN